MKKILIDVNSTVPYYLSGKINGIGRTTLELVQSLAIIPNLPFEVILYSQNMKGIGCRNMKLSFRERHFYIPNREKYNKLLAKIPLKEWLIGYDLMHIPHNFGYVYSPEKCVVTLHDALFMKMQEAEFAHKEMIQLVPPLMRKCKAIMTCSEASKQDIVETMHVSEDKVTVVPWGISKECFFPALEEDILNFRKNRHVSKPYFLMVSCNADRKNTISLMRAFKQYAREGGEYDLILVWSNPPQFILEEFESEIKTFRIKFLSNIKDSELRTLYSGAEASFFPSKYEGFGLPILESMACGTSVVTCRNSSLPEVGGNFAFYTEPEDLDQMSQYMSDFENRNSNIIQTKEELLNYVSKFSWENTAKSYVKFYEKYIS